MGATAFQKGLGSIHSVSHVLGAHYNVHHGLANAIIMPYGLAQNASALEGRTAPLCQALGLRADSDVMALVDYLVELRARLDIPHTLSELGLDDSRAAAIGAQALSDPSTASNARPLSASDLEELFRAALDGDFRRLAVR